MRTLGQDLRYGLRLLLASPGFTAVAVLTLALGIAASTTVYAWLDGMVLHPLPGVREDQRLAVLENVFSGSATQDPNISFADYREFREHLSLLDGICLRQSAPATIGEGEDARRVWGELVSGDYFSVLGVKPVLGRIFAPDEVSDKASGFAAVISYRLWQNAFQGDRGVIGRTIRANRQKVTIVGVAPPKFRGVTPGLAFDIWVPLVLRNDSDRSRREYGAFARLKPGVSVERADAQLRTLARRLDSQRPAGEASRTARLVPMWKTMNWGASGLLLRPLRILAAACALVLLIACANVANLLLARGAAREGEFAIRAALGAGTWRILRQRLTETLLLAAFATAASMLLVLWTSNTLAYFVPPTALPVWFEVPMSGRVALFAAVICLCTAALAGLPPALQCARANLSEHLTAAGRSGAAPSESHRLGSFLVVSEVALALVALTGAVLFLRSFHALRSIDPGFDPNRMLVSRLYLATSDYTPDQEKQFCLRLRDRLASAPGVSAVSYADSVPLSFGLLAWDRLEVEGYAPAPGESMIVPRTVVSPGYFASLRIPLLAGRAFALADGAQAPHVIVVSETFARRFFAGRDAIGRRVNVEGDWNTIAGVVKDSKYSRLDEPPQAFFYRAFDQAHGGSGNSGISFFLRTARDPAQTVRLLRREMAALDPNAGGFEVMPLADYVGAAWFAQRVATTLLGALGAIALALAAVGLYSVMSYSVARRTREFGICMALGARPYDVLAAVLRRGMALTGAGLLAGLVAALALTRLASGMLFGITTSDPLAYGAAALFLASIAAAASYVPAHRATRVNPVNTLRGQ